MTVLEVLLEFVVCAGASAAVLAGLVLLVELGLGRWIAPRYRHALWLLVAVRLLLPVAPSSSLSVFNLWAKLTAPAAAPPQVAVDFSPPYSQAVLAAPQPAVQSTGASVGFKVIDEAVGAALFLLTAAVPLGALGMLGWTICVTRSFSRRVRQISPETDPSLIDLLNACRKEMEVRRKVPVLLVPGLSGPALMGLWRPRLLLPPDVAAEFTPGELRLIVLHELAHLKRWDVAVNWLLAGLRVAHWFNPVFWLAAARITAQRELACDAVVIKYAGVDQARAYGEMLLKMVERSTGSRFELLPVGIAGLWPVTRRAPFLKIRIARLSSAHRHTSVAGHGFACLLLTALAIVGLTDPRSALPAAGPPAYAFSTLHEWQLTEERPATDEPLVTRTYEVEQLLRRFERDEQLTPKIAGVALRETVKQSLGAAPQQQDPAGPRVELRGTELSITASERMQKQIGPLLELWTTSGVRQVAVAVRIITTSRDLAAVAGIAVSQINAPFLPRKQDSFPPVNLAQAAQPAGLRTADLERFSVRPAPALFEIVTPEQQRRLIALGQAEPRSNVMHLPKITLFNGQTAFVADQVQRPFVIGIKPKRSGEGVEIQTVQKDEFGSVVRVIREGTRLQLRPVVAHADDQVRLDCEIECTTITSVKTTSAIRLGAGQKAAQVQLPEVQTRKFNFTADVAPGKAVLVGGLKAEDEDDSFYILIEPKLIELD
jgi:beta-lactamase regulating signal transducer with metallopeptidase domain